MIPDEIDFLMRRGDHPNAELNTIEKQLAEKAFMMVNTLPQFAELGYKRTYNFMHLLTFYESTNPYIIKLMNKLEPYPWYIEMEMTQGICPLRCKMCELTYWNEEKIQLTFDKFKYVMDQFPDLKWAGNNALGDPFTNPDCWKIWKYLDDKDVCQEIYLTCYSLNEEDMKRFLELKGLVFFKISFDAATKETYEKIRVNSSFDKVIRNIKRFDYEKRKLGRYFPEIQFHYIIMKSNIDEAVKFVDFVDSLDVDCKSICYSRLLHNFKEINDEFTNIPQSLVKEIIARGKSKGIKINFSLDIEPTRPAKDCLAWMMPYIFPDGTVISCCCMNEQNRRDWQRETSMGNVFNTPFRNIWYGEKYTKLRHLLYEDKPLEAHPVCNICNIYKVK